MKLSEVPWEQLRLGQIVETKSVSDRFRGHISRLDRSPMVWISWDDGNNCEYTQSILSHVDLLPEFRKSVELDTDQVLADRAFVDAEGE